MHIKINNGQKIPCYHFDSISEGTHLKFLVGAEVRETTGRLELRADDEDNTLLTSIELNKYPFQRTTTVSESDTQYLFELFTEMPPEPPAPPEPPEPSSDPVLELQLAIAELAEAQAEDTLNLSLAIAELAEALLGGE